MSNLAASEVLEMDKRIPSICVSGSFLVISKGVIILWFTCGQLGRHWIKDSQVYLDSDTEDTRAYILKRG